MQTPAPARHPDHTGEDGPDGRWTTYPGAPVDTKRQLLVKLAWTSVWALYLAYPVQDLTTGQHTPAASVAGAVALAVFLAAYLSLVVIRNRPGLPQPTRYLPLGLMAAIAVTTSYALGESWLTLFTYTSVCAAIVLPGRFGFLGVLASTGLFAVVGLTSHADAETLIAIGLPCVLAGLAMLGMQRLVATMRELREARAAVAHLAASEERLRLARDLHDLLGHSLSLIAIKSELTGRLMDAGKAEDARTQVADIEQVARQSLADVRSAVSGFRRPTLPVELAAARTALAASQIELDADPRLAEDRPGLGAEESGVLAWALREAVTNVVRHGAGATRCAVHLDETWEEDGRYAVLEIVDNGPGPGKSGAGNGLSGLSERLELVGGRLQTGPANRGKGFRLRATVPLRPGPSGQ
ncbi:sensor histidine kinase [Streptomyces sp. TLI_171]|uniref:sensor histidine kinase n=1 Tax=Streptomyces sp. TLI_171 TaxID=1938859 RepID=UPI000C187D39|nr:sensor histidine kinase [Streptomyces sp. TLI_171]